ncbi:transcriptional regulatory protein btr [Duganella caerulea]|uniref:helix-turn-helix domain-containing protein n=1 Tax=Duganella caerulea TaxID=2885762 RepID=UPI0030E9C024
MKPPTAHPSPAGAPLHRWRGAGGRDALPERRIRVPRDGVLYHCGDPVKNLLYVVRYGAFKTCRVGVGDSLHITGFQMTKEFLALEALGLRLHRCQAVALEDSEVCEVSLLQLTQAHLVLHELLSDAAAQARNLAQMLRCSGADQRLAAFLLNMSHRFGAAGYSARSFRLQMARVDIAQFLGLTAESVSRSLARFGAEGVVQAERRLITICDAPRLCRIAGSERAVVEFAAGDRVAA